MRTLSILKNWTAPDLRRQAPGDGLSWNGVRIAIDQPAIEADAVVVLNKLSAPARLRCPRDRLWLVVQEPPIGSFAAWHDGAPEFARIYSSDPDKTSDRHRACPGYPPWHVDRSYDQLKAMAPPEKPKKLSAVVSAKAHLPGHRARLDFLHRLEERIEVDRFGRGSSTPLDDKWDGLAPYRYSLAIENFSNSLYWTEKIADCFLAWTMPIYHGCTAIDSFFPAEAMVTIDIEDPDAPAIVEDAVLSDRWLRHRDAIANARELVLDRYNLLAWLTREVAALEPAPFVAIDAPAAMAAPSNRPRAAKRSFSAKVGETYRRLIL